MMRRGWWKGGRGERRKGKTMRPKCQRCRTKHGSRRSLLRRTRAPGGRRMRETGGEVRSVKNTIIKAARREERGRVQAHNRERGRRRGKARERRSVKDTIAVDWR